MSDETRPAQRGAFAVVKRGEHAAPTETPVEAAFKPGVEERSGRGAIGVTIGILGGYAVSYLWLVPLFGTGKDTKTVFLMTFTVMAAMVGLGIAGYFATRRKPRPGSGKP